VFPVLIISAEIKCFT